MIINCKHVKSNSEKFKGGINMYENKKRKNIAVLHAKLEKLSPIA